MNTAFRINNIVIAILGLPTMAIFVYEDSLGFFTWAHESVTYGAWLLIVAVIFVCLWQLYEIIFDPSVTTCKGLVKINKKMLSIIEEPGNTCIVSRNLSWTSEKVIMDALRVKAAGGDLSILVNEENETAQTLRNAGATVITYDGIIPKCRFTIKGYGGAHSRLYIAKASTPEKHIIFRHTNRDDVTLRLAEDVVDILKKNP